MAADELCNIPSFSMLRNKVTDACDIAMHMQSSKKKTQAFTIYHDFTLPVLVSGTMVQHGSTQPQFRWDKGPVKAEKKKIDVGLIPLVFSI